MSAPVTRRSSSAHLQQNLAPDQPGAASAASSADQAPPLIDATGLITDTGILPPRQECPELYRYLAKPFEDPGQIGAKLLEWACKDEVKETGLAVIGRIVEAFPHRMPFVPLGPQASLLDDHGIPHGVQQDLARVDLGAMTTSPIGSATRALSLDIGPSCSAENVAALIGLLGDCDLPSISVCFSSPSPRHLGKILAAIRDCPSVHVAIRFENCNPEIVNRAWQALSIESTNENQPMSHWEVVFGPGCGPDPVAHCGLPPPFDSLAKLTIRMDAPGHAKTCVGDDVEATYLDVLEHLEGFVTRGIILVLPHTWQNHPGTQQLAEMGQVPGQVQLDIPARCQPEEARQLFQMNAERWVTSESWSHADDWMDADTRQGLDPSAHAAAPLLARAKFGRHWERKTTAALMESASGQPEGWFQDPAQEVARILHREGHFDAFKNSASVNQRTAKAAEEGRAQDAVDEDNEMRNALLELPDGAQMLPHFGVPVPARAARSLVPTDPKVSGSREFAYSPAGATEAPPQASAPADPGMIEVRCDQMSYDDVVVLLAQWRSADDVPDLKLQLLHAQPDVREQLLDGLRDLSETGIRPQRIDIDGVTIEHKGHFGLRLAGSVVALVNHGVRLAEIASVLQTMEATLTSQTKDRLLEWAQVQGPEQVETVRQLATREDEPSLLGF
jgi:hypothetical protein